MSVIETIAKRLRDAYQSGPVPPIAADLPDHDPATAYAVQEFNTRLWQGMGRQLVGRKIGLTSLAVQRQLGVDQPDYGALFADMAVQNGGCLRQALLQPRIEAEIAFVMGADMNTPPADVQAMAASVAQVLPAFEIVDSRIADWRISLADTIADNGSSGRYVLGAALNGLGGVDLVNCTMALHENGQLVSEGTGAACLGNPLAAAVWLASAMIAAGNPLKAGDLLLSGALGPMVPMRPGCTYRADISGLGSVSVSYAPG